MSCFRELRVLIVIWAIVLASLPVVASKKKPGKATLESVLEAYNFEQIEQVAIYLTSRVEADPLPKGEKIIKCDPAMMKVNAWLAGPMPKLQDESRQLAAAAYVNDPASFKVQISGCSSRCSCEAYRVVLDGAANQSGVADSPAHQANLKILKQEMRKVSAKFLRQCATKAEWFCDSELQKYLAHPRTSAKKN